MASYYDAQGTFLYSDDPGVLDPNTGLSFIDPATGQLRPEYQSMAGQVAMSAGAPAEGGAAGAGGAAGTTSGVPQPFAVSPTASPDQAIQSLLSLVAPQLRGRLGGLLTAIPALQAQANASPMALLGAAGPQVNQLSQQYRQGMQGLSRTLGPFGGGFRTQGQRQIGGQFGTSLARLFAGIPGQASDLLGKIAEGTSIAFPVPRTQIGTGTRTDGGGLYLPTGPDIKGITTSLFGDPKTGSSGLIDLVRSLFSSTRTGTFGTGDIGGMF